MASFREIMVQPTNYPTMPMVPSRTAGDIADIIGGGLKLGELLVQREEAKISSEAKSTIAYMDQMVKSTEQMAKEAEQKTKEMEQYGLPIMIANSTPEQLADIIKANPGLSPNAQFDINNGIAKKYSAIDSIELQKRVLNDPNRNVSSHVNNIIKDRSPNLADPVAQASYTVELNQAAQNLMSNAVVEQAKRNLNDAMEGVKINFTNRLANSLRMNNLSQDFYTNLNEYAEQLNKINPNISVETAAAQGVETLTSMLAGPLGQNIGLDPLNSLDQVNKLIAVKGSEQYPELVGLQQHFEGISDKLQAAKAKAEQEAAQERIKIGNDAFRSLTEAMQAAQELPTLNQIYKEVDNNYQGKIISGLDKFRLDAEYNKQVERVNNYTTVLNRLGINFKADGTTEGNWLDPADNANIMLGPEHDNAIDKVADRLGIGGISRINWQMSNFGKLTKNTIDNLNAAAETNNAADFATALVAYNNVYASNPNYAATLVADKKLSPKLEVASVLVNSANMKPEAVIDRMREAAEVDLVEAGKLLTPEATKTTGANYSDYADISRKVIEGGWFGGKGGAPSKEAQDVYTAAFKLAAANITKAKGAQDPAALYAAADAYATDVLKKNTVQLNFADKKYLLTTGKAGAIGVNQDILDINKKEVDKWLTNIETKHAVDRANIRFNFDKAISNTATITIPIEFFDVSVGEYIQTEAITITRARSQAAQAKEQQKKIETGEAVRFTPVFR